MKLDTILHKNGRVTYWSVYCQCWVRNATQVPREELEAMKHEEREKVVTHLKTHGSQSIDGGY